MICLNNCFILEEIFTFSGETTINKLCVYADYEKALARFNEIKSSFYGKEEEWTYNINNEDILVHSFFVENNYELRLTQSHIQL